MWVLLIWGLIQPLSMAETDTIPLNKGGKGPVSDDALIGSGSKPANLPKSSKTTEVDPTVPEAPAPGQSGPPKPFVASIETFGSEKINEVLLKRLLGKELDTWLKKGLAKDPSAMALELKLAKKVADKYGFVLSEWSPIEYRGPEGIAIHITLDVVEKGDMAERMPFYERPHGQVPDPGGILKTWGEYETVGLELIDKDEIALGGEDCVAFHCPFGHKHDRLKKYEALLVEGAKKNADALVKVLKEETNPLLRGQAVYVLAYLKDGKKLVSILLDHIKDPDFEVRNNVLRVLGEIAEFHSEVVFPIKPVLEVLNYPRVSDRSKATAILASLVEKSQEARTIVLQQAVPQLLKLLASYQPDHKELAHLILRKISGKDYPLTDLVAWQNWHHRSNALQKPRGVSTK